MVIGRGDAFGIQEDLDKRGAVAVRDVVHGLAQLVKRVNGIADAAESVGDRKSVV